MAFIAALVLAKYPEDSASPTTAGIAITGPEEVVFDWDRDACDETDIPDAPARAFRDATGQTQLIASHYVNRPDVGPDLNKVRHRCEVVMNSNLDPNPANFNDREWIAAPYSPDGRTVYALVHDEYQGDKHLNVCPSGEYLKCWYNTITLAVSSDSGRSFQQAPPPSQLIASLPYTYEPDAGPYGLFNPSNIVRRDDGYFYSLLQVTGHKGQRSGTCVMRTRTLAEPASWRAWDGSSYSMRFVNPYQFAGNPLDHTCEPVSFNAIQTMSQSLTYNTHLDKYVLVSVAAGGRQPVWGIYFSLSSDLIEWTERKLVRETELPWTYSCGDRNPILYPSLLDPRSDSRNFETTGESAYMYFTRFHYRSCMQTLDRDLMRVPIRFVQ